MEPKIIFVTGGSRSGKSLFAEKKAAEISDKVVYIATSIPFDDEMKDRVKKHKERRPGSWATLEQYFDIHRVIKDVKPNSECILLDCVTIMVSNLMFSKYHGSWDDISTDEVDTLMDHVMSQVDKLIDEIRANGMSAVMVSNEIGMGIVPDNKVSRIFRDIAGKANQLVASKCDEAYLLVSSLPVKLK
jgi:adenosylcobinamide kinase / adenosylcobinamide-phosphate guanylyltransferase